MTTKGRARAFLRVAPTDPLDELDCAACFGYTLTFCVESPNLEGVVGEIVGRGPNDTYRVRFTSQQCEKLVDKMRENRDAEAAASGGRRTG